MNEELSPFERLEVYECQYCGESFEDLEDLVWHEQWDHKFNYR